MTFTTDHRVRTEDVLRAYPGHAFCDECLAQKVGMSMRAVRRARIALAGSVEFDQQVQFCSVCLRLRHVIHVAWLRFDAAPERDARS